MKHFKLIGPFRQLLTMNNLQVKGALSDNQLEIVEDAGVLIVDEQIYSIGKYVDLKKIATDLGAEMQLIYGDYVVIPGLIDAHTHICYSGSRSVDYANRLSGMSYLEIAESGGGIWSTVSKTREASNKQLYVETLLRAERLLNNGVTTAEVKSGYDLTIEGEILLLEIINELNSKILIDLIPTCLAAHIVPCVFNGSQIQYLEMLIHELLPKIKEKQLANRVDIFVEQKAFSTLNALFYLEKAKKMGFDLTVHADQFTVGGSEVACKIGAVSADHLEASTQKEIEMLARSSVISVCLPGASLGLGMPFAPARKMLNAGASLAIASDWNPGSAPMGDLLVQACLLGASEKLTSTETLAALTFRSAAALNLSDRGKLVTGMIADFVAFPTADFREICYNQGALKPNLIWKKGIII